MQDELSVVIREAPPAPAWMTLIAVKISYMSFIKKPNLIGIGIS